MKRCHFMVLPLTAIVLSVIGISCVGIESYHHSVDVPRVWTPTDTLFYDVDVDTVSVNPGFVQPEVPYLLTLEVRHTDAFLYRDLSLNMFIYPLDSLGQYDKYVWMQWPWHISAMMTDEKGLWNGDSWGSLIQKSFDVDKTLTFPEVGHYRIGIVQDWDTLVCNIVSIGVKLEREDKNVRSE